METVAVADRSEVLEFLRMHAIGTDLEHGFVLFVLLEVARVPGSLDFRHERRGHLAIFRARAPPESAENVTSSDVTEGKHACT